MSDDDVVETYRDCKFRVQKTPFSTGSRVETNLRYSAIAKKNGNQATFRGGSIDEIKLRLDQFLDN